MATSDLTQRVPTRPAPSSSGATDSLAAAARSPETEAGLGMLLDVLTVLTSVVAVLAFARRDGWSARVFDEVLASGSARWFDLAILGGFALALVLLSHRLHLYTPARLGSFLQEQGLTIQVCLMSGVLLMGALYLVRDDRFPRRIVLLMLLVVTISLCIRRFLYRVLMYRRFERGQSTRNVLIVGTGPEAHALRHHIEKVRSLGYTFKGFIESPEHAPGMAPSTADVVGTLETLFELARKQFVDEIVFTIHPERPVILDALERAREQGISLRVVPDLYEGLRWERPIEYIGQFPTIAVYQEHVSRLGLFFKRCLDVVFSILALFILAPFLFLIAIAIKLESPGPVFYRSERIGRKGAIFGCFKFRTMVRDADKRRSEIMHMNERDGVLFKVAKDPRITRLGRFLRKYSVDELPQFINVLRGEMSVVGPRPPLASEVMEYRIDQLRRLDVAPGITGLWQVEARQNPSFDSYVLLDFRYIENWSMWLDIKIILRTVAVVFSGTGS